MSEQELFEERLMNWTLALDATDGNAPNAADLMEEYYKAENDLLKCDNWDIQQYKFIQQDSGCRHCWLSSRARKEHIECEWKITRFFLYREQLISKGWKLLWQKEQLKNS